MILRTDYLGKKLFDLREVNAAIRSGDGYVYMAVNDMPNGYLLRRFSDTNKELPAVEVLQGEVEKKLYDAKWVFGMTEKQYEWLKKICDKLISGKLKESTVVSYTVIRNTVNTLESRFRIMGMYYYTYNEQGKLNAIRDTYYDHK